MGEREGGREQMLQCLLNSEEYWRGPELTEAWMSPEYPLINIKTEPIKEKGGDLVSYFVYFEAWSRVQKEHFV